jgi:hypothetical protein
MLALLCPPLHIPRAAVDPIDGPLEALGVITLALTRPLTRQLVAVACDSRWRGLSLSRFTIDGDTSAHVCDAVDRMIGYCSLVEASNNVVVGIGEPDPTLATTRLDDFDGALERCAHAGIALREWLIVTRGGVSCARG